METRTSRRGSVSRSRDERSDSQQLQPGHETHLGEYQEPPRQLLFGHCICVFLIYET